LCGNFILPEPASYVFFYAVFNLRNLLYIIDAFQSGHDFRFEKQKRKTTTSVVVFLVEISGIEPLTS
jgi:hypothetical protein